MSEYQYVHFLALDRPLDDKQLEFMERQSSRAEITKWEFSNEYHFGSFRGDAEEMLRRGYDVHLHYANFGIRKLMFRLPAGLPWDGATFDAFCPEYGLEWHADKQGRGGILEIEPEADGGTYDDGVFEVNSLLTVIAPVRELLIAGDLRPLYVAWLACSGDDEALEPPVPAGLGKLPPSLIALAEFYELDNALLEAAAERSPPLPKSDDDGARLKAWVDRQTKDELTELVRRMLTEDATATRAETLARIRDEAGATEWLTAEPTRTLTQLYAAAKVVGDRQRLRAAQAKEKARHARLAKIAADPQQTIAEVETLVKQRSLQSYETAAQTLADLREALGSEQGTPRAQAVAEKLRRENPTLKGLVKELRKHGLLVDAMSK